MGCSAGSEGEGGEGIGRGRPEIEHDVRQSRRKGTVTDAKGSNVNGACAIVLREAHLRTKKSGKKVSTLLKKKWRYTYCNRRVLTKDDHFMDLFSSK